MVGAQALQCRGVEQLLEPVGFEVAQHVQQSQHTCSGQEVDGTRPAGVRDVDPRSEMTRRTRALRCGFLISMRVAVLAQSFGGSDIKP